MVRTLHATARSLDGPERLPSRSRFLAQGRSKTSSHAASSYRTSLYAVADLEGWCAINKGGDDTSKVYAYQYEVAMQDGKLSSREREMLRLTAKSLGLTKSQAKEIEQQFSVT